MDPSDPSVVADLLTRVLREAGARALEARPGVRFELKRDGSPVSEVDRELDADIASALRAAFPTVGVRGEEGARFDGVDGTFWVDPIDGTQAYVDGLPYWGPTVALVRDGRLEVGAFYAPGIDEMWVAVRGGGAWRNGARLEPRWDRWSRRKQSVLAPSRFHRAPRFPWAGKVRAFGSSAAHLALVAGSAAVATLVPRWSLWDVGCGALLVTEVGGALVGLDGKPIDVVAAGGDLPFLAGAPTALHDLTVALGRMDGR